jgi:hypothetical protein
MNRKVIAGFALATALAVPISGLSATTANAAQTKQSSNARNLQAKNEVAQLKSPYRKNTKKYSQWYAKQYMQLRYGWGSSQQAAIIKLWTKESGWNHKSSNGSSGAYGIPQSLPGRKMASHGKDWRTNPETQIRWGLSYIKGRYGSPNKAWAHFRSHNWY